MCFHELNAQSICEKYGSDKTDTKPFQNLKLIAVAEIEVNLLHLLVSMRKAIGEARRLVASAKVSCYLIERFNVECDELEARLSIENIKSKLPKTSISIAECEKLGITKWFWDLMHELYCKMNRVFVFPGKLKAFKYNDNLEKKFDCLTTYLQLKPEQKRSKDWAKAYNFYYEPVKYAYVAHEKAKSVRKNTCRDAFVRQCGTSIHLCSFVFYAGIQRKHL